MKKYLNTYQVHRDMEKGKLSREEGEKILAEMHATTQSIRRGAKQAERSLERSTHKLDKSLHNLEKSLNRLTKALDRKLP